MLLKIRALFAVLQFTLTVSVVIVCMYLFKKNNRKVRRIWAKLQMKLMGVDIVIKGELDPNAQMLLMNHQSILDIVVMESLHPKNLAWVAKQEIAKIPWFGLILKAPQMIIVQRESKTSLVKLLRDAKDRIEKKRPIAIFPEGTRTDGKKLRKFKAGAKMIADKNNLLVQPVVIVGTREIFDSQNLTQQSGKVKVIFLPAIQAQRKTPWYDDIENLMNETLKKELRNDI
jgi:1-acyl-sn-glycerol-3-phosphate acyltransferase